MTFRVRTALVLTALLAAPGGCRRSNRRPPGVSELKRRAERALLRGDRESAAEFLRRALARRRSDPDLANRLGLILWHEYLATGEESFQEEALARLRAGCRPETHCAPCCVNLGNALWLAGRLEESARAYRLALEWAPQHPDRAILEARIQRAEAARRALGEAGLDGGAQDSSGGRPRPAGRKAETTSRRTQND